MDNEKLCTMSTKATAEQWTVRGSTWNLFFYRKTMKTPKDIS